MLRKVIWRLPRKLPINCQRQKSHKTGFSNFSLFNPANLFEKPKVVLAFYILDSALVFNRENSINQLVFILIVIENVNKRNRVKDTMIIENLGAVYGAE